MTRLHLAAAAIAALTFTTFGAGCDGDDLDSDTEARRAYLGFDRAIDRGLELGLAGYNAATNANIPAQEGAGDEAGTMTVSGQVDQGASDNKELRLDLALVAYDDGVFDDPDDGEDDVFYTIVYDSGDVLPALDVSLRDVPDGTFTGTLSGTMYMTGDVEADAVFALTLSGGIMEDPQTAGNVVREPGTLVITGTVTSGDGMYEVNVTR